MAIERQIQVYSGSTIENYRTCAFIDKDGHVLFDKDREPRHEHPRFFYDDKFSTAVTFGSGCANYVFPEHTLLVMRGTVPDDDFFSLDPGEFFPVDRVYVPKPDVRWQEIDAIFDKDLVRHFQELDPKELLSQ